MASSLRIVTIKRGEQAVIKVNSEFPVTLEFDGHSITLWAKNGMVFQRLEAVETETQVEEEEDAEPYEETQLMFTPEKVTIRSRLTVENRKDIQDLQMDLFDHLEEGDTQLQMFMD